MKGMTLKPRLMDCVKGYTKETFMKDLEKAGVEEAEEEFTKIIQDTVELWSK